MEKKISTHVILIDKGPMILKGQYEITDRDGSKLVLTDYQKNNGVAICRCGKSQNQPFCDGSHAK